MIQIAVPTAGHQGVVVQSCNPSTWEVEVGQSGVQQPVLGTYRELQASLDYKRLCRRKRRWRRKRKWEEEGEGRKRGRKGRGRKETKRPNDLSHPIPAYCPLQGDSKNHCDNLDICKPHGVMSKLF